MVTLPEVPPPAEAAVEAGVEAARSVQQAPDQQKGQLQGQAVTDLPEERGQQQLQGQDVSDPPEQPAAQRQQQGPPQGVAGAFQRRWERLGRGTQGQGRAQRADTLKPLQRASADALKSPQRQAAADALKPLQRQVSADTLKPLPSRSEQGQWQTTSNFQAPLQRQQSAGHTRKVSTDGSGRPPKSPTVSGLQSPQRCAAHSQLNMSLTVSSLRRPQEARCLLVWLRERACLCATRSSASAGSGRWLQVAVQGSVPSPP